MMETLQPPTDNLYKFLAIGGLVFALVAFIAVVREQARDRQVWIDAQVELKAAGYEDGPALPTTLDLRRAYFRREYALADASSLLTAMNGTLGYICSASLFVSFLAFALWWKHVQRHEDVILRMEAAKLMREEQAAKTSGTGHS